MVDVIDSKQLNDGNFGKSLQKGRIKIEIAYRWCLWFEFLFQNNSL